MDVFGIFQNFRCKFSTVLKFSEYILFSKDGTFRLFVIFRLYFLSKYGNVQHFEIFRFWFLFKGWNSPTYEMDIFGFSRWKCIEKTKQHRIGSIQRSLAYQPSTLPLRHTFTYLISKIKVLQVCSFTEEYCILVFLCCRKRLSPK